MTTQKHRRSNVLRRNRRTTRLRAGLPDRYVPGIRGQLNGECDASKEFIGVWVAACSA